MRNQWMLFQNILGVPHFCRNPTCQNQRLVPGANNEFWSPFAQQQLAAPIQWKARLDQGHVQSCSKDPENEQPIWLQPISASQQLLPTMFVIHLLKFVKKMLFPAHLPFLQEKTAIYMIQKLEGWWSRFLVSHVSHLYLGGDCYERQKFEINGILFCKS